MKHSCHILDFIFSVDEVLPHTCSVGQIFKAPQGSKFMLPDTARQQVYATLTVNYDNNNICTETL